MWFHGGRGGGQSEFIHERPLLGALAELLLPVAALPGELRGERGRVVGQTGGLRVGFLGGINVLDAIPEPRVLRERCGDGPQGLREQTLDKHRLVEPRLQDAIEHGKLQVVLLDADALVVHLVVEATAGVVVPRGVASRDIERHVQAAGDLVEDLALELAERCRRLLGMHLAELPSAGKHGGETLLELDLVHRLKRIGLAVGGAVGVDDGGEVGGGLGGRDRRQCVPAELREQRERRRDVRDAAELARPVRAEVVHDRRGRKRVVGREVVDGRAEHAAVTGVPLEHAVGGGVAPLIQSDAVDLVVAPAAKQGRADLVGLDELEVKRDGRARRCDAGIVDQKRERLAALCPGQPHGAELSGEVDRPRPLLERILDASIRVGVVSEHLQPGTGADGVVGEREDDALGIRVVGDLVAGAIAEYAPHLRVDRGVGREAVRIRPMLTVLRRGLGRVELGDDQTTAAARSASVRSTRRRRGGRGGLRPATDPAHDVGDGFQHGQVRQNRAGRSWRT